jgi:hypothetical protein
VPLPLYALGDVALFEGRLEEAARLYTAVAELAESADDAYFAAYATASSALPWAYLGDTRRAVELADRAKRLAQATRNPTVTAWADYILARRCSTTILAGRSRPWTTRWQPPPRPQPLRPRDRARVRRVATHPPW